MPTPSKAELKPAVAIGNSEWAARPAGSPRSVFGNYPTGSSGLALRPPEDPVQPPRGPSTAGAELCLQTAIDNAMARSFLYRFLAQAYEDPSPPNWEKLSSLRDTLDAAVRSLEVSAPGLAESAAAFTAALTPATFESFLTAYLAAFGHAARGRCPLNEIEYGDLKADPLFQPHRLADLAAYYRAFGLEVAAEADERHDHLCLELEFMCVLAAKEAYALEHQLNQEELSICRLAQKRFLREHLGRWTPAFTRRLANLAPETPLGLLANLTRLFLESECVRFGVPCGSEDLLLRPVDETAESMCNSCGLTSLPPGASHQT